jgi:hypothetical protein
MAFSCVETACLSYDSKVNTAESPPIRWMPGTQIVLREHWNGKVWTVRPVTVVHDSAELIALYMMPGTTCKHPRDSSGEHVSCFLPDAWILVDTVWNGGGALYLTEPNSWYVLMGLFGLSSNIIESWYINLQTPYERTPKGFDYLDQELDILVNRELSECAWKDEEKFANAQRGQRIPLHQAAHVRQVGEDIVARIKAQQLSLPQRWINWQPSPCWPIPHMPLGWERIP